MLNIKIGPYQIRSKIGQGGMGDVYLATDAKLNRDVAVKILPRELAQDASRLKRFEQEAQSLAALNHPNLLVVHDAGAHEGTPYLVTELLSGRSLREALAEGALPTRQAVECASQIARGLTAAHARGIVRRDLKPENLFVTTDDPSPEFAEGPHLGAKTVSRWRQDFLRDLAARMKRCQSPAKP